MLTLKDIASAHDRIRPYIHRTPVLTNNSLNEFTGANLFFKCENFCEIMTYLCMYLLDQEKYYG